MATYIFMIVSTIIMATCVKKCHFAEKKNLEILFKIMVFLMPFLVMALRYGIGQDYFYTYVPIFETVKNAGTYPGVEIGYILLNQLVQIFTYDYAFIFILTSFIYCIFIYKAIIQESKDITLSFFILFSSCFFFYAMNVTRQSIVIAIFIFSIKYIREKKIIKYMILILIASLIHKIALIFIPIYFIGNLKLDLKKLIILTLIVIIGNTFISLFVSRIVQGTKYENYLNGIYNSGENGGMISPAINVTTLLLCLYYKRKDKKNGIEDNELNILTNVHVIAFLCSLLLGSIPMLNRVFINFYHVQILTIPLLLSKENRQEIRFVMYSLYVLGFLSNFIYSVGIKNGNKVLPYQTIFDR